MMPIDSGRPSPDAAGPQFAGRVLYAIAAVALVLRVALVLFLFDAEHPAPGYEHAEIAENLLLGRGFSVWYLGSEGPTSQQAPLLPLVLAGIYFVFGIKTAASHLLLQLLQCLLGAGLVLGTGRLAQRFFPNDRRVWYLAATGACVFPIHIYMVSHVQVATAAACGIVWLLVVATGPLEHPLRRAVWLGVLSAVVCLIDPILVLAAAVAGLAFLDRCLRLVPTDRLKRTALAAVTLAISGAICLAPWTIRNYQVHGQFVFVKASFGYAFWQGNNPFSHGTDKIPKANAERLANDHDGSLRGVHQAMIEARDETIYIDDLLLKPSGYEEFQGLTEPQRSDLLLARAERFIVENPRRYVELCLQRAWFLFVADETNPKTARPVYRYLSAVLLGLSAIGFVACLPGWRRLWPTYAVVVALSAFHILTIVSGRFRIPLEPIFILWCGVGVNWMWSCVGAGVKRWGGVGRWSAVEQSDMAPRDKLVAQSDMAPRDKLVARSRAA